MSEKCQNTRCEHHRRGGGCKLFEGLSFLECRQAIVEKPRETKPPASSRKKLTVKPTEKRKGESR